MQLPENRFIPEDVQEKMISLFKLGNLKTGQIMTLIEKEHFPDVKVTWSGRDVQDLTQKVSDRNKEASDLIQLLQQKRDSADNWRVRCFICPETMRLKKEFSGCQGKDDQLSKILQMFSKEMRPTKLTGLACLLCCSP